MNLAVSNLSWENSENTKIFEILKNNNIKNIEGVLSKISSFDDMDEDKILKFKNLLDFYNIKMQSIQSIFYGVDVNTLNDQEVVLKHFNLLVKMSKKLNFKVMVFGSPNLRKKIDKVYLDMLFKKIDNLLDNQNLILCIEPNTKKYNGEYFFSVDEIVDFIESNNFKNIKTMIDTHNIILEGEDPITVLDRNYNHIYHIHVSEENLKPLMDLDFHLKFSDKLKSLDYKGVITYELLPCDDFENEIKLFKKIYS
jgi:sugar phosphate isomerase/epimerase